MSPLAVALAGGAVEMAVLAVVWWVAYRHWTKSDEDGER